MEKKLASPIKQVVLARIHVSGGLKFVRRRDKLAIFLVDLAQQVVQFPGVFLLQQGSG